MEDVVPVTACPIQLKATVDVLFSAFVFEELVGKKGN